MRLLIALLMILFVSPALAQQETPDEERSLFLRFIEDRLSGPNRQIRISGIEGVLSSNARIGLITVADDEGVWLRIENASIDWSRSTLILRQRLQIDTLAAERIQILRRPVPDETLPAPEAGGFQVPELPIAVNLDNLAVPLVEFGEDLFGLASQISVNGSIALADGSLDTQLQIERLDGPGGQLALDASYANETEQIGLDLALSEPENGIVANLLALEGRPPVDLRLAGSGPISNLDVTLTLDAAGERILSGATSLRRGDAGLGFEAELEGPIAQLVPVQFRSFFGQRTALTTNGVVKDAGGFRIDALELESAALALSASAETQFDGFLQRLSIDAVIDNESDEPVILPVPGGSTTVQHAEVTVAYGEAPGGEWSATIVADELNTAEFLAGQARFEMGGVAANIDNPVQRSLTFNVDGDITGIVASREDVQEALGDSIALAVAGSWRAGDPIRLADATLTGETFVASLIGNIEDYAFNGNLSLNAEDLSPFSGLAGRELDGAIELRADGELRPISGAFDLTIDSSSQDLGIGTEAVDNLIAGTTTITGRVARGEDGLTAENLRVGNERVEILADGTIASEAADFDFSLSLSDLALLSDQASGALEAEGRAVGSEGLIAVTARASVPTGTLAERRLGEAQIAFDGTLEEGRIEGTVAGSAFLDGVRTELSAGIDVSEELRRLSDLDFSAGGARATGELAQDAAGLLTGELVIDAPDVSTAAALALVEASGALDARLRLTPEDGTQSATIEASAQDLVAQGIELGRLEAEAAIRDLFGVPAIEGSVTAERLAAAGIEVATLRADASTSGDVTSFDAAATLENGSDITAAGSLQPEDGGFRLALDEATLTQGLVGLRLVEPAALTIVGDTIDIETVTVDVGGGRVVASGRIADELDLDVDIAALPLSIANLVRPDLGLGGTVDADLAVSGTRDEPSVDFTLRGSGITAAALRAAGQESLDIEATGNTTAERLQIDADIVSPQGLRASANGSVPLGDGNLDLQVNLDAFPLTALNPLVPGQDLAGAISGSATVRGTLAAPQANFDLRGTGIAAAPLRSAGLGGLEFAASGAFADQTVRLNSLTASASPGLRVSANGTIPISGSGLSVNLDAEAPLSIANRFLADRGTQVTGTATFDGSISGSISEPAIDGTFSTRSASVVDPETNVRLGSIDVAGTVSGQTVTIQSASAALATGGTISAGGTISLDTAAGMPADIRIGLNQARYADGELVVATLNGNLAVNGPLLRDPLISGDIAIERAEITVSGGFGGGADLVDVIHRNPPPGVRHTLERARANDGTPTPSERPSVVRLDISISAPNQIFVRGRGLDAELGGNVRLTGPITSIQPVGGFELIRGRLSILTQRITFDEGTVTLVGDLDPFVDFVARSSGNDITVFITVRGRVSDLEIEFSSQPELPEDEVLARLIFDRSIDELSAFQIAQLAAAAAELAGGGDNSLLGSLRQATGLDDIDIVTDSQGNAAVRAGRYIQDNIYLGVEAGAQGNTRGTINLDITESLKAKGAVGTGGDSSLGIFFERDY